RYRYPHHLHSFPTRRSSDLNLLLPRHQRVPSLLLDLIGHRIAQRVGRSARDRFVLEAAEPVDFGFVQPVEQIGEIGIGLTGKAEDRKSTRLNSSHLVISYAV